MDPATRLGWYISHDVDQRAGWIEPVDNGPSKGEVARELTLHLLPVTLLDALGDLLKEAAGIAVFGTGSA